MKKKAQKIENFKKRISKLISLIVIVNKFNPEKKINEYKRIHIYHVGSRVIPYNLLARLESISASGNLIDPLHQKGLYRFQKVILEVGSYMQL